MKEYQSLSHTRWGRKDHIVFIPKRRKKRIFGVLRRHLGLQVTRFSQQCTNSIY
jgi:putative transposase